MQNETAMRKILSLLDNHKEFTELLKEREYNFALNDCIRWGYVKNIESFETEAGTYVFNIRSAGPQLTVAGQSFLTSK